MVHAPDANHIAEKAKSPAVADRALGYGRTGSGPVLALVGFADELRLDIGGRLERRRGRSSGRLLVRLGLLLFLAAALFAIGHGNLLARASEPKSGPGRK